MGLKAKCRWDRGTESGVGLLGVMGGRFNRGGNCV